MSDVSVLDVRLYDEPIGTLTHIGGDRTLFAFNDAYIQDNNRPVLGLGFKDQFGELITEFRPTRIRVAPFFSNLLPEGHLRTFEQSATVQGATSSRLIARPGKTIFPEGGHFGQAP